jgi:bifunctional non-homologous end joining protein LigD
VLHHEQADHEPIPLDDGGAVGPAARLGFIEPMAPTLVSEVPAGDEWQHEIKFDGYRTQIVLDRGSARAFTRRGFNWTGRYPGIVEAAGGLACRSAIIDGEVIVQDAQGRSDFGSFKEAMAQRPNDLVFMAFDLLHLDGKDLRSRPLEERREGLRLLLGENAPDCCIHFSDHVVGNGAELLAAADSMGLEGIVSKRRSSRYRSGASRSWLKVKCFGSGEFVVIGTSKGDRAPVALLARETDRGLEYAGAAMVTLADPERDLFWRWNEQLKTPRPAVPMEPRKETSWLRPEMRVRAQYLRGEEMLRHATVQALVATPDEPRPAKAAASKPSSEPTYRKPPIDKAALAAYYRAMAPVMLPWLAERPLNLFRCPGGRCLFQRNENHPPAGDIFGEPIRKIPVKQKNGRTENYLYVDDAEGILACLEAEAVEFHGWGSRVADIEKPNRIAFDLDPDEGLAFERVREASHQLRRSLQALGLKSFPLLTGGKGIHVVVPLTPEADWPQVREFARAFCAALAEADPERFTIALPKAERRGRIFLDYLRNQRTATAILPYSARARPGMPVAVPIAWKEVDEIESAARFSIADTKLLVARSRSRSLRGWGEARQTLPRIA